jgi:hypothetical protein
MRFYRRFLLISMLALQTQLLLACVVIPEYPTLLPPLVPGNERFLSHQCPNLAGQYSDKGVAFSPNGKSAGEVSLSQLLHKDDVYFAQAEAVSVVGPEHDAVEITSLRNEEPFAVWRMESIEKGSAKSLENDRLMAEYYLCERGFVRLPREYFFGGDHLGIGGSSDFLRARKAVDGSLMIFHRAAGGGLLLFIPIPTRRPITLWYRFPPADLAVPHAAAR